MPDTRSSPQVVPFGDRALVVVFGKTVDPAVNARARAYAEYLLAHPIRCVTDVVPGYAAVTVHFDSMAAVSEYYWTNPMDAIRELLEAAAERAPVAARRKPRSIEIPVCYGGEYGPDLEYVALHCRLEPEEVIRLHAAPTYLVYMLGFVPGFGYLGGLDPRIEVPRRDTPRKRIPAGSVAIGGSQTGVYPVETPGGWNLIGRTPRKLFRLGDDLEPNVMEAGDTVRFVPVSAAEFERLKAGMR